ncbi:MlaA family lipoprotein [Solilutibacter silvestris]|uniref:VacJ like lipoprotein n=1 Tax=Solilutibacter silvestris TaxID=1645665 RepID=A0A2K1Q167_9GAMM|nr:VacJ family lipoprotein [Lysobacter silvestris]PNS08786.1 VacJ like lipoprotein [Lysobacter silvestris]
MVSVRTHRPVIAAALVLALTACAQQGGTRADAASAGTVVPATPAQNDSNATPASVAAVADTTTSAAPVSTDAATNAVQKTTTANDPAATSAEADYQALYGDAGGTAAQGSSQAWDPWEPFNRKMHAINNAVDHAMIHPVAVVYSHVMPRPIRTGVSNFFRNLGGPSNTVNAVLQGRPSQAGGSLFRFLVNSTFGIGGLFDVATAMHIPDKSGDLGQTFATWGWKKSRYLVLPVFGPRTVRDAVGMVGDMQLTPLRNTRSVAGQVALQTVSVINIRAQLLSTDALREGAIDDYRLFRDAWWQRRNYQLWNEDKPDDAVAPLPEYLQTKPD